MDSPCDSIAVFKEYAEKHDLGEYEVTEEHRDPLIVSLTLKSGRDDYQIEIPEPLIQRYVDMDFAQYRFFSKYHGIVSYDRGYIEVETALVGYRYPGFGLYTRIFGRQVEQGQDANEYQPIEFGDSEGDGLYVNIGPASEEFLLMVYANQSYERLAYRNLLAEFLDEASRSRSRMITLRIEHLKVRRFSEAEEWLRTISDSCFFCLSRECEIDLQLSPVQRQRYRRHVRRPKEALSEPHHEYPPEALSFYRYGLSAQEMPLLQFLAFYQVVEFFFSRYSLREVETLAVNYLKDPAFSEYDPESVQELIRIIKNHRASDNVHNERDQLRAVLTATLHPGAIIRWITEDKEREDFFRPRGSSKKTSQNSLDVERPENLISQLTERIYDIRCKIVHAKSSGTEQDFLLPYSEEALHLSHDIDLMQEVAERVLIASSSELSIPTARPTSGTRVRQEPARNR